MAATDIVWIHKSFALLGDACFCPVLRKQKRGEFRGYGSRLSLVTWFIHSAVTPSLSLGNRISSGQKRSFYDFQLICYSMWILQSWIGLTPPLSPSSEACAEQGTLQRNTSCGICSLHGKSFENVSLYAYYAKFYQTKSCTAVGY